MSKKIGKKLRKTSIFRRVGRLQEIFQRFPCILTKFLILKTGFAGIFRNMYFLCAKKLSSRSSRRRLILKYLGNLVKNLMTMWWNSYCSKFDSEIWRWLGILGISVFIWFFNFLQILWRYSSVNKKSVIENGNNFIVSPL